LWGGRVEDTIIFGKKGSNSWKEKADSACEGIGKETKQISKISKKQGGEKRGRIASRQLDKKEQGSWRKHSHRKEHWG